VLQTSSQSPFIVATMGGDFGDKGKGKGKAKGRRSRSRSPVGRHVVVKLPTGRAITFDDVAPSTTIVHMKAKIAMETGIPIDKQRLVQELPDLLTLETLGDDRRILCLALLPLYI